MKHNYDKGKKPKLTGHSFHDYVIKNARSLPLHECWVNEGWERAAMSTVFVTRRQVTNNLIVALYHLDKRCLGILRTTVVSGGTEALFESFRKKHGEKDPFVPCEPDFAFSLVYGSLEYAANLGFEPNPEFRITQFMLPAVETIKRQAIEFGGVDGKPMYVPMPDSDDHKIKKTLETLRKKVGNEGFDFVAPFVNSEYAQKEQYNYLNRVTENPLLKVIHPAELMSKILPRALGDVLGDNIDSRIDRDAADKICEEAEIQAREHVLLTKGLPFGQDLAAELRKFVLTMVDSLNKKMRG